MYILKKTPSVRTEKDIEVLRQYSKSTSFLSEVISKVGSHNYLEICLALEYKFVLAGHYLTLTGIFPWKKMMFMYLDR